MVKKHKNKKIKKIFFKTRKKRDFNSLPLFFFLSAVLVLSFASYVLSQPYAPLDTGPGSQEKQGPLKINTAGGANDNGLIVTGKVGIGIDNPQAMLDVNGPILLSPSNQPSLSIGGMLYYDQTSNSLKFYNGTEWKDLSTGGGMVAQVYKIGFGLCQGHNYITCYIDPKDKTIDCPCGESDPQYCIASAPGCAANCVNASTIWPYLVNENNAPAISQVNTVHASITAFDQPNFGFASYGETWPSPIDSQESTVQRGIEIFTSLTDYDSDGINDVKVVIKMRTQEPTHFRGKVEVMVMGYE